jgi:hypothetical protein
MHARLEIILIALLSTSCSAVVPTPVAVAREQVTVAAAEEIDPDPWHFVICTRQTETKQIEIQVGKSVNDYAVLTWNQGEAPAIPVPPAYAAEQTLWVRVRVFDRKIANVCLRSEDTSRKDLVTDREIQATVARTDTDTCPCP